MKKQYTEDETNRAREYLSYYADIVKSFNEYRDELRNYIDEPVFIIDDPTVPGLHVYNIQILADIANIKLEIVANYSEYFPYLAYFYFSGCKFFGLLSDLEFTAMTGSDVEYEIVSR